MITIATNKLNIDKLKSQFKNQTVITTKEIADCYRLFEPNVKQTTINWRVYNLVQTGILSRIGRGKFNFGKGILYVPEITSKMKSIYNKLKKEFPYLKICIWNTSAVNEFMRHQPGLFYLMIEVEKEATQSVFYFLKEMNYPVFLEPKSDILEKYVPIDKEALIIKPLISEAPTQNSNGFETISLEKLLVDIYCDEVVFSAQQGAEMRTIFKEAFGKYVINQNRMTRYASRRRKKESFNKYLHSIINKEQQ
ncbi:MAG: hypothetical protein KKG99_02130 [Bacteroidetes bacterium]|nr:hypothetical protein [Bacteroidota bacterium]